MSSGIHGDRLTRFMASGAAAQPAAAALINERRTFPAGDAVAGWLEKFGGAHTGRGRGWQRRWFVLSGVNLLYFASPADAASKGSFDLSGAVVGASAGDSASPHGDVALFPSYNPKTVAAVPSSLGAGSSLLGGAPGEFSSC